MSILVKGMEMPKDGCHHMICIYADGTVSTGGRVYMAVPVPPHGRLIDADRLAFAMMDAVNADQALAMVDDAPIVIEAESYSERELQRDYEASVEYAQHCGRYEPTYDQETGAM